MMNDKYYESKDMRELNILHRALAVGASLIIGVFYYLIGDDLRLDATSTFFYLGFGAIIFGVIFSEWFYKFSIKQNSEKDYADYDSALWDYRAANIRRWALIEGPILISTVLMFIDSNMYLLFAAIVGLFFLLYSKLKDADFEQNYKFPKTNS